MVVEFIVADFDVDSDYNQSINPESRYRKESEIFVGKVLTSCTLKVRPVSSILMMVNVDIFQKLNYSGQYISLHKLNSKLVPFLKQGAGVVTTRAHVHYVVTEYGVANLYEQSLRRRARALIGIAHPSHREMLEEAVFEGFHSM